MTHKSFFVIAFLALVAVWLIVTSFNQAPRITGDTLLSSIPTSNSNLSKSNAIDAKILNPISEKTKTGQIESDSKKNYKRHHEEPLATKTVKGDDLSETNIDDYAIELRLFDKDKLRYELFRKFSIFMELAKLRADANKDIVELKRLLDEHKVGTQKLSKSQLAKVTKRISECEESNRILLSKTTAIRNGDLDILLEEFKRRGMDHSKTIELYFTQR